MKVAIIGGGASGLISAIEASNGKNEVTIYEKNSKCGKKILVTGNGRCNYFNDDFTIEHYNSTNIDILKKIINQTNKDRVLKFFDSIGIVPKICNGYYYPISNQASTIQEALILEAKLRGVKFVNEVQVINITFDNKFIIDTLDKRYYADKVIIATGSNAALKTGSDGLGYSLARSFKHSIIKPLPSLVQLIGDEKYFKEWAGVRSDVKVTLYENNVKIKEVSGEIQLTDYGVSGICIFQLSSKVVRGLEGKKKEVLVINFLPWLKEDINTFLSNRNDKLKDRSISELLDGLLNYKLVNLILKKNKIKYDKKYLELTDKEKSALSSDLIGFRLEIVGNKGFESSQVSSGGIPLKEININTMESVYQKGLYIVGELLDVDGECGGYNLGFAWLSGILAGEDIKENL